MKRILSIALSTIFFFLCSAQENIQFGMGDLKASSSLSQEASNVLESKVSQILNRNSAAAGGLTGVFVIDATLDVEDSKSTSGLVQNVTQIAGSVVLTAKNYYDSSEYYSVTVPLNAVAKGSVEDSYLLLARSIKITDPAYVRFIKKARENITRALAEDCDVTVERAQALITAGYYEFARGLLLALPPGNSCNDLSMDLLAAIRAHYDAKEQKKEDKENELRSEKMRLLELKIRNNSGNASGSDTDSDIDNISIDESDMSNVDIYSSNPAWSLKVLSCKWIPGNRRVSVGLKVETKDSSYSTYNFQIENVITDSGDTFGWRNFETSSSSLSVPANVGVKCSFDIKCNENPKKLSFVKLRIGSTVFEIKNLSITTN